MFAVRPEAPELLLSSAAVGRLVACKVAEQGICSGSFSTILSQKAAGGCRIVHMNFARAWPRSGKEAASGAAGQPGQGISSAVRAAAPEFSAATPTASHSLTLKYQVVHQYNGNYFLIKKTLLLKAEVKRP